MADLQLRDATPTDVDLIASILRQAFRPVAERFGYSKDNCPTHTSFAEPAWILWELDHGAEYVLAADESGRNVGCISLKQETPDIVEAGRLAVLPGLQGRGYGTKLLRELEQRCAKRGIGTVTLGIVSDNTELHEWYTARGYEDTALNSVATPPF
jgi:ribosomal protein S18 acetylase RimI-like enzyme